MPDLAFQVRNLGYYVKSPDLQALTISFKKQLLYGLTATSSWTILEVPV